MFVLLLAFVFKSSATLVLVIISVPLTDTLSTANDVNPTMSVVAAPNVNVLVPVSYTHLTLPTTPYV